MSTRNKPKIPPPAQPAVAPSYDEPRTVSFSLRLPEGLKNIADSCTLATGTSLNGLICTALAEYLSNRGYQVYSR